MPASIHCDCGSIITPDYEVTIVCACGRTYPPVPSNLTALYAECRQRVIDLETILEASHNAYLRVHKQRNELHSQLSQVKLLLEEFRPVVPSQTKALERIHTLTARYKMTQVPQDSLPPIDQLLYEAWTIIANAGQGDWGRESEEWQEAARRWRDQYHARLDEADPGIQRVWRFSYENGHATVELGGVQVSSLTANGESWVRRTELDSLYDSLRTLAEDWTHEATKEPMAMAKRPWIAAVRDLKKLLGPRGDTTNRSDTCEHGISRKHMPYTHYSIYHKEDHP